MGWLGDLLIVWGVWLLGSLDDEQRAGGFILCFIGNCLIGFLAIFDQNWALLTLMVVLNFMNARGLRIIHAKWRAA